MDDDAELLRRYAEEKAETAFAELARRHVDFVYAAACRQTRGNSALAEDITQAVFTDFARKAAALSRHEAIVGWLHTATRFAAGKAIRTDARRRAREREAHAMNETLRDSAATDWARLDPVIDDVLGELKERERTAILLRFFERKSLAEVGGCLSLSETAARSCVDRALEKMRERLARRGIDSTAAALALALTNQVAIAAPGRVAARVASAAIQGTRSASSVLGSKPASALALTMVATGAIFFWLQQRKNESLLAETIRLRAVEADVSRLRDDNARLKATRDEIVRLRADDSELIALQEQVATLTKQLRDEARAEPPKPTPAVILSGQVKSTGRFTLKPSATPLTLREFIEQAGGFTDGAKQSGIRVTRTMPNGPPKMFTIDYAKEGATFTVEPGDVVYVPEGLR
ncbi:MAG TPA: sigma-70 family RNA polymerase sigma factor [Opitutaceae bacterium]|nr:sigma-70 family RNA polymerase sigma factor [Opitutaceae bacterium]